MPATKRHPPFWAISRLPRRSSAHLPRRHRQAGRRRHQRRPLHRPRTRSRPCWREN